MKALDRPYVLWRKPASGPGEKRGWWKRAGGALGLLGWALLLGPLSVGAQEFGAQLIRNFTPPSWQAVDFRWCRDVQPRNKVDDLIDESADELFDVVVNFKRCLEDADITMLNEGSATNRVQMRLKYISSAAVSALTKGQIRELAAHPDVAFIERQFGFSALLNVSVPGICATAGSPSCPGDAAALGFDGTGVNIAIMDSGVDNTHVAFTGAFVTGYDADTATPGIGDPDDTFGHGTHVASIALGRAGPNTSRGVAPGAGLIDVKVPGQCVSGWPGTAQALEVIYDNRNVWSVQVINMSFGQCDALGGTVRSDGQDAFSQLVDLAESMNIVVVAAAGNSGPANIGLSTPAAATRAITVAAANDWNTTTRADDLIANFSSGGPRDSDGDSDQIDELKPEVTAPGGHGPNCVGFDPPDGIIGARLNTANGALRLCGTSMAAPHVAGLAALIIQARPGISAASVKDLIISTATPMGTASNPAVDPVWNNRWGWGLVNAFQAVSVAQQTDLTFPSHPPSPGWLSPDLRAIDVASGTYPPKVGQPARAFARVQNKGPAPANNVRLHFGVHVFSASTPTFQDIGTLIVNIPVHAPGTYTEYSFDWVPQNASHQCLKVEIGYGPDIDYSNNRAQRNITVQASPATFMVQNTLTEEPALIQLVPTMGTNSNGGTNWTFELDPAQVVLGAADCPVRAQVELFPGANAQPGERQVIHVAAVINTIFGPVTLGGVTVEAVKPMAPTITMQPGDERIPCGGSVTLTVTAAGTEPLSYQWRYNGVDIPGATGPTLSLSDVGLAEAGDYSVAVSNSAGTVTSDSATLTIVDGPIPLLRIVREGNEVVISWPLDCQPFSLEEATDLAGSWSPAVAAINPINGRNEARLLILDGTHFFKLRSRQSNEIPFQPPARPIILFDDVVLTRPPLPLDAVEIVEVPWTEIPDSLTDEAEARLRQAALQVPAVRQLLGSRFAFLSADRAEPNKGLPQTNLVTQLFYYSHTNNIVVEVLMNGFEFSSVAARDNEQPPAGADEVAEAIDLARRDDRLRDQVQGLAADALVRVIESPGEPGFDHRVLLVTFSLGDEEETPLYTALVDLTAEAVLSVETHTP